MEQLDIHRAELVLLDLDGTVLDIAARPDAVTVGTELKASLQGLLSADPHGLVVVTGRGLADTDRLLAPLRLPVLASHGAESRVAGTVTPYSPPVIDPMRPVIEHLLRAFPEAVAEWKPFSAAIHIRSAPELGRPLAAVLDTFAQSNRSYRIERGKQVFEIIPAGVSKAEGVCRLLRHLPYAGRHPIYVGDDAPDDAAMQVVEALGGMGLRVAGEYFAAAQAQFSSPAEVRSWLRERAHRRLTGTSSTGSRCISQ